MKSRLLFFVFILISLRGYTQSCSLTVSITQSEPAICAGNTITLTAIPKGGSGSYDYAWSTGETGNVIHVNKAITYTVSVTDKVSNCLASASVTVTETPTPAAPTIKGGGIVCKNTSANLTITSPAGGFYQWYTDPNGVTPFHTGSSYTTPPITEFTVYYVDATVGGCTGLRTAVGLNIVAKPSPHNTAACLGSPVTLSVTGGDNYQWYGQATGGNSFHSGPSLDIASLQKTVTYYVESNVNGCASERTQVTATVTPPPQPPVADNVPNVCSGSVVSLHASAPAGIIDWFATPTGGTSLISSPDYTTPALTTTTTYYVQTTTGVCQSARAAVVVTVNPIPTAPQNQTVQACFGTSAKLTAAATPTGTYQWYSDAAGKHIVYDGNVYDTPPINHAVTYYVANISGACRSALAQVNVTVGSIVPAPSVTPPLTCYGTTAKLIPSSPVGVYQWFKTATDNNALFTGNEFVTPALTAPTTYYVQTTVGSCTSVRVAVNVPVLAQVTAPTALNTSTCEGNSATLTATGPDGDYAWYDSPAGTNLVQVGKVFATQPLSVTTTYYVKVSVNGCESKLAPVTVTVKPTPVAPTANNAAAICPGTTANLSAAVPAGGVIDWFETPNGGASVHTGTTFTTPVLYSDKTYYLQNTSGTCTSARTPLTVPINTSGTTFNYPSGTVTTNGADPTPLVFNPSGGTFSASPEGIIFISTTTGQIDASASTPGTYVVTLTSAGTCSGTYSTNITITNKPVTNFFYQTPSCQDAANPSPSFLTGGSPGVFSATPAGLVFVDITTGKIDLGKSKVGSYIVKNTIPIASGSPDVSSTAPFTINEPVFVDAGSDISVPAGTPVTLQGNIAGGASGGKWTGGLGKFSNPTDLHAIYTPLAGESKAILTLTSNDPLAPCLPKSKTINIFYNTVPPAPTVQPVSVCIGDIANLSATAPGGNYSWYQDATGGISIHDGATFKTPPLTANTTYYVETRVNNLISPRTAVLVSVSGTPLAPVAPDNVPICSGSTATLIASGSTGTYQWYTKTANGQSQLVATGPKYEPSPMSTTSYFVQATLGNCVGPQKEVVVQVNQMPNITSTLFDFVCSGNPLNYTITADLPTATFLWERKTTAGISNPAVTAQTSSSITETLINTTANNINVTYTITPMNGTCAGTPVNYVVTVYPTPMVTGANNNTICDGTSANYAIEFNTPATVFSWSRAAVPGIFNAAISGQAAGVIREVLFNTTNAPVDVTYLINYRTNDCDATPFTYTVTVNPQLNITSDALSPACSKTPEGYTIVSNVPSATFSWSRDATAGISNPAVSKTGALIDETLVNTTLVPINVTYVITPAAFGCTGFPFTHVVTVNPKPATPVANSNSPVCVGNTIQLNAPPVAGATYLWTGPNGFSSALLKPTIPATPQADGIYNLFVTVRGCTSDASPVTVKVNQPPVAKANGPQLVCTNVTSIELTGSITGGTTTGVWSSSNLKGRFLPSSTQVDNVQYIPTQEEKNAGSVTITLTSTSKDDCSISTSSVVIKYGKEPGIDAGPPSMDVCIQDTRVQLAGKVLAPGSSGFWTSSSTDGTFESGNKANAVYLPSVNDKKNGSVILTFNLNNSGDCYTTTDNIKIVFLAAPLLTTEKTRYVLTGSSITLQPTTNNDNVTYLWSPNVGISDIHVKNPIITGTVDMTYTLIITDNLGCSTPGTTDIIVQPQIFVKNAFTPNGDGVNDNWEITGLVAYENSTVDVYNRYGTQIFHSRGYGIPWDGNVNGQPVPGGVYYYIVDTKSNNNGQRFIGNVTILR